MGDMKGREKGKEDRRVRNKAGGGEEKSAQ